MVDLTQIDIGVIKYFVLQIESYWFVNSRLNNDISYAA